MEGDGANPTILQMSKEVLEKTISSAIAVGNRVLREELTSAFEHTLANKLKDINDNLGTLNLVVNDLKKTANDAYEEATRNAERITKLEATVATLNENNNQLQKSNDELLQREVGYKKDIAEIGEALDDQSNRGMRGNLVFYGLNEEETEHYSSKDIISNYIFNHLYDQHDNITLQTVHNTVVRAHRAKRNPSRDPRKNGPRPIFVKFDRDDTAANYLQKSIKREIGKGGGGVRIKKQFTKKLQARIDEALQHRRHLLTTKAVTKAFVDYPAVLKGMYTGTHEFVTIQTF